MASDTVADRLRELGTRGCPRSDGGTWPDRRASLRDAECYCHKGRRLFDPRVHSSNGLGTLGGPLPPRSRRTVDVSYPWNVRLSHVLCNRMDYGWRMRIRRMIEKRMSLEEIAEDLSRRGIRRPHGSPTRSATTRAEKRSFLSNGFRRSGARGVPGSVDTAGRGGSTRLNRGKPVSVGRGAPIRMKGRQRVALGDSRTSSIMWTVGPGRRRRGRSSLRESPTSS